MVSWSPIPPVVASLPNGSERILFIGSPPEGTTISTLFGECPQNANGDFIISQFTMANVVAGECLEIFPYDVPYLITDQGECILGITDMIGSACLEDDPVTIGGSVVNRCSIEGIEGIEVQILGTDGDIACTAITDALGNYECSVPPCQDYTVEVNERCDQFCKDGISTVDLVEYVNILINGSYSQNAPPEDILIFSADFNQDGVIDFLDINCLRGVILHIGCTFVDDPNFSWCNFVSNQNVWQAMSDFDGDPNALPSLEDYETQIASSPGGNTNPNGSITVDFSMYPMGDMNCDCYNEGVGINIKEDDPIRVTIQPNPKGEHEVILDESTDIEIFSIDLDLPAGVQSVEEFSSQNEIDWEYNIVGRTLKIIGINTTGKTQSFKKGDALFSLKFNKDVARLDMSRSKDNLLLTSRGSISYLEHNKLTINPKNSLSPLSRLDIDSYTQTGDDLQVVLKTATAQSTNIAVFDIFGRQIHTTSLNIEAGLNTIELPLSTPEGVYILSVFDGETYQSEKFYWNNK